MTLGSIIGLGIIAFLFLYITFNLEDKHQVVKGLALFFALFSMLLVAKSMIDNTRECDLFEINNTVTGNTTTYNYDTRCYDNTDATGTPNITFNMILGFISFVFIYLIGFLFWFGGGYLKEVFK